MEISLSDWQEDIATTTARFGFCAGGRRVGKSHVAAARILLRCCSKPNQKVMYISPVLSQHEEVIDLISQNEGYSEFVKFTYTRPYKIIFKNGSVCSFRSFERPRNIRGKGLHDVIVDESQDISEKGYEAVIRPLVSGAIFGSVLLLGQFRGTDWRFKKFYTPGQEIPGSPANPIDFGRPRYRSWRIPSELGPFYQTPEGRLDLETARSQLAKFIFDQEYGCEVLSNPSALIPEHQIKRISSKHPILNDINRCKSFCLLEGPRHGRSYICGLDVGKVKDPSSICVVEVETKQVVYIEVFPLGMEHAAQAKKAALIAFRWKALLVIDATGGGHPTKSNQDEYILMYRNAYMGLFPENSALFPGFRRVYLGGAGGNLSSKRDIISSMALDIEQQKCSIPPTAEQLLEQLLNYEAEYKNGAWIFTGASGFHDDLVVAFALALWAVKQGWIPNQNAKSVPTY